MLLYAVVTRPMRMTQNFFEVLFKHISKTNSDDVLIGGDFNTVMNYEDLKGGKGYTHHKCTRYLNRCAKAYNLSDIWKIRNPNTFRFTWCRFDKNNPANNLM